jgi:Na+-driven multidrug efflux pump
MPLINLKTINYKLFAVLLLSAFIPTLYSTVRINFLGTIPDPWAFSIASQVAWLNIAYEVISEGLLLPLAFILGQVITDKQRLIQRMSLSLILLTATYAVVTMFVIAFTPMLLKMMQHTTDLVVATTHYIRLESIAIFISSIFTFCSLVFVLKNNQKALYLLLLSKTLLIICFDTLFVSQSTYSLQLGVNGVAYTNIAVNSILFVIALGWLIKKEGVTLNCLKISNLGWLKQWLSIGLKSGLESFVRNAAFVMLILKLVNEVQQAGVFWVTNQFIWGWLLLPVLALGQLIKQDAACAKGISPQKINSYMILTGLFVALWLLTLPFWSVFIRHVMGIDDYQAVYQLSILLVGFYIVFAFNNVIDSYFYGIGRTDLMLYQSLLVNSLFYGSAFAAYQLGWFIPRLDTIAIMFGLGITFDAVITFALYRYIRNQERQKEIISPILSQNPAIAY